MTFPVVRSIALALSIAASATTHDAAAQSFSSQDALRLLPANAHDQVAAPLRAPAAGQLATADLDRTPVAVSWGLDPDAVLDARPQAFVHESREYWLDASEAELQRGVSLALSAPGAVIRLSPHAGNTGARIERRDIVLRAPGPHLQADALLQALADEDALREAGMDVPAGSVALRLAESYTGNRIELAVPTARGAWLLHVYEPNSKVILHLGTERDSVAAGATLRVHAGFPAGTAASAVSGLVSAPDGHSQPLQFTRDADGRYSAQFVPDAAHAGARGLWEVHAYAQATYPAVPRDARSAFSVALPVARLDGRVERMANRSKPLALRFGVETVAASRYQLSAVLYGRAADGSQRPAATAQSAAWLEAGQGFIDIEFDAASLSAGGLASPWELRDLRLANQADLGLLERRERALVVP
jgi:hypothetical protein